MTDSIVSSTEGFVSVLQCTVSGYQWTQYFIIYVFIFFLAGYLVVVG